MIKVRVYEVAREVGLPNRELVQKIASLGIQVRNHMSALDPSDVDRVKRAIEKEKAQNTVEERIRPTVVRRRTVARDYLYEDVPLLGSTRIGPDLANFGSDSWRNEPVDDPKKPQRRDASWLYQHMYAPKSIVGDSLCPPLPFMFTKHEVGSAPSPDAVRVEGRYEWIPTAEARNLAAYILGQDRSFPLPEAPTVITPKEEKK